MNSTIEQIVFDKYYSKLDDDYFTTIRTSKKDVVGKYVKIIHPRGEFSVECIKIEEITLINVDNDLLMKDTDTQSIYDALEELKLYYSKLTLLDKVYVYYFDKKLDENKSKKH